MDLSHRRPSAKTLTAALTVGLAAMAAGLIAVTSVHPLISSTRVQGVYVAAGLAVVFGVAELLLLHVEFRSQAYSFTLSGIPLALGLLLCSPRDLLAARLVGAAAAFIVQRPALMKAVYNLASYAFEVALTATLLHWWQAAHPGHDSLDAALAFAVLVVICAVDLLMVSLVLLLVRLHAGSLDLRGVLEVILPAPFTSCGSTAAALIAVVLLQQGGLGQALLLLGLILLALAYRSYRVLHRRHQDLETLHDFVTDSMTRPDFAVDLTRESSKPSVPGAELLRRTRTFMAAESVELILDDGRGQLMRLRAGPSEDESRAKGTGEARVVVEDAGAAEADWLVLRVRDQGDATLVPAGTRDRALRQWLALHEIRDAILAPVRQTSGNAVLIVKNRTNGTGGYHHGHLSLMQTIAGHFAVALQSSQLLYRLRYDATHDPLTGLANRTVLCGQLDAELAPPGMAISRRRGLAVLLLDLNRFKEVNDTLGHHVGDALLQVVARRLRGALPSTATIARLGGDEFAIVLRGMRDPAADARGHADAIIAALATPVRLDDALVTTQVSVGIALEQRGSTSADLLRHADTAMYTAKTSGGQVTVYSAELDHGRAERLALLADLQSALQRDEFVLRYQPKLELEGRQSRGRVTSVEALVRWQHPRLGLLSPDAFIPLAEATGLVEPLTRIVLGQALRQCREWAKQGLDLSVAVNLPARSVANPTLPAAVAELLLQNGIDATKLILEITESSVMGDPDRSVPVLEQLASMGVTLSLDDFGTGYSSLSYLQRLPVRELKIDRSFIRGLGDPNEVRASTLLIRSIVSLAAGLQLRVVAEGVEDEECLVALLALGVDVVQGYFVGRPVDPGELARQLSAHRGVAVRPLQLNPATIDTGLPNVPPQRQTPAIAAQGMLAIDQERWLPSPGPSSP